MFKNLEIDLHGKSLEEGEGSVNAIIKKAVKEGIGKIVVITGRGNHPSLNGTRGLFFKRLPKWLNSVSIRPFIKYIIKNVGSYEIILKNTNISKYDSVPIFKKANVIFESTCIQKEYLDETELMKIIRHTVAEEKRHLLIKDVLSNNPGLLEQTCSDGTTVLMIATSYNQVNTMKFLLLQERELGIDPKLLKQERHDGVNALMVAVVHENIESINFLLQKAPGLLKRRRHDGVSVFTVAANTTNPKKVLDVLYKHLEDHKREKGYTDLFREYQILNNEINIKNNDMNTKKRIQIIESASFKKYAAKHAWFFIDRMFQFLETLKTSREEINDFIRRIRHLNREDYAILKARQDFKFLLERNNIVRQLFLRFNNSKKERTKKNFKHALHYSVFSQPIIIASTRIKKIKKPKTTTIAMKSNKAPIPMVTNKGGIQKAFITNAWQTIGKKFDNPLEINEQKKTKMTKEKRQKKKNKSKKLINTLLKKNTKEKVLPHTSVFLDHGSSIAPNKPLTFSNSGKQLTANQSKQNKKEKKDISKTLNVEKEEKAILDMSSNKKKVESKKRL